MKCTDCNGSKVYVGLGFTQQAEACGHCGGNGIEPGSAASGAPLRDYQQQAVDDALAKRALWTGHSEFLPRSTIMRLSGELKQFPGRVHLELSPTQKRFMDAKCKTGPDDNNVRVDDAEEATGLHWLLVGVRDGGRTNADRRYLGWNTAEMPRSVILDYAQQHYLALYQRIEMKNEFKCIWHY